MKYDVILLSYSKTAKHIKITKDCIASLRKAENKIGVNIIVIESFNPSIKYDGTTTVFWVGGNGFNYNESMNYAFTLTKEKYVFFCNNDLDFSDYWADHCYHVFSMGINSLSPYCKTSHPRFAKSGDYMIKGYQVGFHIPGWCIGVERETFVKLGGFNTAVRFWYSDNIYAEQLKIAGIRHALVCNSFVRHLDFGSQTLLSLDNKEKHKLTSTQKKVFNNEVKRLYKNAEKEKAIH